MIPDPIPASASDAEVSVFKTFKSVAQRNWEILHGVEIPSRVGSTSLIDFVIFIPNQLCVICIVVNPSTNPDRFQSLSANDLELAKEIMEELKTSYIPAHPAAFPLSFGYAAVLPDPDSGELKIIIPDSVGGIVSESLGNLKTVLENYAGTLNPQLWEDLDAAYPGGIDWGEWEKSWDEAQLALYKLRFDLVATGEMITTIATRFHDNLETHRSQLLRLTEDQLKVLRLVGCEPPPTILPELDDQIQINSSEPIKVQSRCVVDGAAGTGKTVLAIEIARQLFEEGKTVGLLCSNPYLNRRFTNWTKTLSDSSGGRVIAGTPATLPYRVFEANQELAVKHQQRVDGSPDLEESLKLGYLDKGWQQFIAKTIEDLNTLEQDPVFDYLIVDEAQNLCSKMFLDLQDALLKNGLKNGRWIMFGDFMNQNIVSPYIKPNGKEALESFGLNWEETELQTNCRNTHEITEKTHKLVGIDSPTMSGVYGPHVQIEYFESQGKLVEILDNLISDWKNRNFQSKQIILLSSGTGDEFNTKRNYSGWQLFNIAEETSVEQDNTLRYSDVYDFQGLESDLAILVLPQTEQQVQLAGGLTLPQEDHLRRVLYTGMSRAKAMLVIVADEGWRETFIVNELLFDELQPKPKTK